MIENVENHALNAEALLDRSHRANGSTTDIESMEGACAVAWTGTVSADDVPGASAARSLMDLLGDSFEEHVAGTGIGPSLTRLEPEPLSNVSVANRSNVQGVDGEDLTLS